MGALALMAIAYHCTPLAAQSPAPTCAQSIGEAIDAATRGRAQPRVRVFRGEAGLAAAKAYNNMAPPTRHQADAVVVITDPVDPIGIIYLVDNGCVVDRAAGPADFIAGFLRMIGNRLGVAA